MRHVEFQEDDLVLLKLLPPVVQDLEEGSQGVGVQV